MKSNKIIIKVEKGTKLASAYTEIEANILDVCARYDLTYFELYGLLESIKMDLHSSALKDIENE